MLGESSLPATCQSPGSRVKFASEPRAARLNILGVRGWQGIAGFWIEMITVMAMMAIYCGGGGI